MRQILSILSLVLFLLPALTAQQPGTPVGQSLLWKIEKPGHPHPAWLFGTIHLIPNADFQWPPALRETLESTDRLVLELDMTEAMNPMTQLALLPRMVMPDGLRLRDLLKEEELELVMDALGNAGLPGMLLENLKPLFLTALVEPALSGDEPMESYDMRLYTHAMEKGMKHSGLETIEEQLTAFDAVPLSDQARMLVEQLRADKADASSLEALIRAYKREDLDTLHRLMEEQQTADPGMMESLLYARNRRWISRMSDLMEEERVFFAVGAGHLAGEQGVIRLLEAAGYRLTPHPVFH